MIDVFRNMRSSRIPVLSCASFAVAGAASRLLFPSVKSRIQIEIFCAVALALQLSISLLPNEIGKQVQKFSFIWNAAAATIAIIITRIGLEGVPLRIVTLLSHASARF